MADTYTCCFCSKTFPSKDEMDKHITGHVLDQIKANHPTLLDLISKVEETMPVKFLLKIDISKMIEENQFAEDVVKKLDQEG